MKTLVVVLFFASIALSRSQKSLAQDHAPSVVQCTADMRLWASQYLDYSAAESARLNQGTPNNTAMMKLSIRLLNARAAEMVQCDVVDPSNSQLYRQVTTALQEACDNRFLMFIARHHLKAQVYEEDEAGLR